MQKADVLRRRALRTIMQAPTGTANEVLQIDAGWCRTETVIKARKIKLAKRISEKPDETITKRVMKKAAQLNTTWCKETKELTAIRPDHLARVPWKRINKMVKQLKQKDLKN